MSAVGLSVIACTLPGMGATTSLTAAVVFLTIYGLGWGCFDCNNMPILSQITRPELRATGYGFMNLISISLGGVADYGFGVLRKNGIGTSVIFAGFAAAVVVAIVCMLLIKPRNTDNPFQCSCPNQNDSTALSPLRTHHSMLMVL